MTEDSTYNIRPAARLIHTIGSDLIGDSYAAVVELVKNSYDADASYANINFEYKKINKKDSLIITIFDDGHGMDFETVINKWLVPATDDKLKRKSSPEKKRVFQGRKGIGRFASSILGQEMTLTSITKSGEKSTIVIDWRIFNTDDFLENVELLVEKEKTTDAAGTIMEIVAQDEQNDNKFSAWDKGSIDTLIGELRKLISPFNDFDKDEFKINLSFSNCPFDEYNDKEFEIETYPIIELYDYRISGSIDKNGNATLLYENNVLEAKQSEKIVTHFELSANNKYCGNVSIDFRVFDREPEAIDNLINKGLIDPISEKYMGKNDAKRLLNEVYGAKVYKNHFRIRPYGSDGVDWLDMDKDRIQNPSLKIGNNQLVGFITIEAEELSRLEEKSARDGLKENEHFFGLKELSRLTLKELEIRRFTFRDKSLKSRKGRTSIQNSISDLFSFSDLSNSIQSKLEQFNVDKENINQIKSILEKEEIAKAGLMEDIQKTIAIYQGQATLGKIVNFILHEGRKPIQYLNSETDVLERYLKHYRATNDEELFVEMNESIDGFRRNGKLISDLFKRVNPLASQRRGNRKNFNVKESLKNSVKIFRTSLAELNIECTIDCKDSIQFFGWEEDLFTAVTNLLENSIYWLGKVERDQKLISISVQENPDEFQLDFRDNGPGLTDSEIESDVIFEPGYSKKHNGTGLGLAIAGESIERLKGKLKARKSDNGAYFQMEIEKR